MAPLECLGCLRQQRLRQVAEVDPGLRLVGAVRERAIGRGGGRLLGLGHWRRLCGELCQLLEQRRVLLLQGGHEARLESSDLVGCQFFGLGRLADLRGRGRLRDVGHRVGARRRGWRGHIGRCGLGRSLTGSHDARDLRLQ
jgi:hypothetical protein